MAALEQECSCFGLNAPINQILPEGTLTVIPTSGAQLRGNFVNLAIMNGMAFKRKTVQYMIKNPHSCSIIYYKISVTGEQLEEMAKEIEESFGSKFLTEPDPNDSFNMRCADFFLEITAPEPDDSASDSGDSENDEEGAEDVKPKIRSMKITTNSDGTIVVPPITDADHTLNKEQVAVRAAVNKHVGYMMALLTKLYDKCYEIAKANDDLTATSLRAGRLMSLMFPTVTLFISMSSVAVLWLGADRINAGEMELGSVVAYLSYLVQVLIAVVMLTFMVSMIPRAAVAAERIAEVLDTDSSVIPPTSPITALTERGTVDFDGVGFTYPGATSPVLSDISFRVTPGRTTAIIGSTGSGKSTIVDLVPRLFDVTEGSVSVNGVDVRQLDPDLLWGSIGYVPQKPYLFSGTVASNLRFGRPDATEEELWQALEVAQGAGFVQSMPQGLESPITQGGTNVSGGQRQRLSIARALVMRPDIYIFDDSFSALDLATDARLRLALQPHVRNAGVLIVAQRVSTIADADQIIVIEHGRIVGRGRHVALIDSCPTYAEIVDSQFEAEAVG